MIEFTTPTGTRFQVSIVTERANLADHNVTNRCYELSIIAQRYKDGQEFGGPVVFGRADVVAHPQHGPCLDLGGRNLAPIPADKVDPLKALLAEYKAEVERRVARSFAREAEYQAHHDKVERLRVNGRLEG